jgi:hypothetical protein
MGRDRTRAHERSDACWHLPRLDERPRRVCKDEVEWALAHDPPGGPLDVRCNDRRPRSFPERRNVRARDRNRFA